MSLVSLLILLAVVLLIGWAALWLINRFIPGGVPRTLALVFVGILLLYILLTKSGLLSAGVLSTPVV